MSLATNAHPTPGKAPRHLGNSMPPMPNPFAWILALTHKWCRTHTNMASMSAAQITTEMTKVEQAFVNIFGKKPAYMRPPNLSTGGQVLPTLKNLGYKVITDDVDAGDWNKQTPSQSEQTFTRAGTAGNGHIPLMHETYEGTVKTLTPWLLNWASQNKLQIVTVGKLANVRDQALSLVDLLANTTQPSVWMTRTDVPARKLYRKWGNVMLSEPQIREPEPGEPVAWTIDKRSRRCVNTISSGYLLAWHTVPKMIGSGFPRDEVRWWGGGYSSRIGWYCTSLSSPRTSTPSVLRWTTKSSDHKATRLQGDL